MTSLRRTGCAAAAGVLLAAAAAGQIGPYAVEYLGTTGSSLRLGNFNNGGQCVGDTTVGSQQRAWVAGPGSPVALLPSPAGYAHVYAVDVNDAGTICGYALPASGAARGVRWVPEGGGWRIELLGNLPGHVGSSAIAINNRGDILGRSLSSAAAGPYVVFRADGTIVDLPALGFTATPNDINDAGQICGDRFRMDIDDGVLQDLGLPPGQPGGYRYTFVTGVAINNSGQVAARGVLSSSQGYVLILRYTDEIG